MKRVVVSTGLQEAEIRPQALMSEFKRLSIQDAAEYFSETGSLVEVSCPACDNVGRHPVFTKQDFRYNQCQQCGSVYVSPRPSEAQLHKYYAESRASRFRVEHFSRDTAKARRYHLLSAHAQWMGAILDETGKLGGVYADYETHSPEIFEELASLRIFEKLYSIAPLVRPGDAGSGTVEVAASNLAGLTALSAFEKLEHQFSPFQFLNSTRDRLTSGGIIFFTTRTISGFDLQLLWDKTPYIFVPEHMNLLSIEGLQVLLNRCSLELVEMSTPGQLDLQFVKHALAQDPSIELPRFVNYLVHHRDALAQQDFQQYLQKHRLSSHVRVAARRAE